MAHLWCICFWHIMLAVSQFCITVDGFTLNIHSVVEKLIDRITGLGGEFLWDCKAQSIQRDPQGAVTMLKSQLGPKRIALW